MIRLILLTDFTEAFPHNLLRGILRYAKEQSHEPWVACRMPPAFKDDNGITGVLKWAKHWGANAIIGRFDNDEDVTMFPKNGIVAVAQDFKQRFDTISNITSDYLATGEMAARFFLEKGFENFAFYGYENIVWSDERSEGYRKAVTRAGFGNNYFEYKKQKLEELWYYEPTQVIEWLHSLPRHTALFCCDDTQGNKITEICKLGNIDIPGDIALLGVDNDTTICGLSDPPLSSVNLDIERGGYETAHLITELMNDETVHYHNVVIQPTSIISRTSTNIYATDNPYILQTLDYIHQNLSHPISIDDILRVLPMSRRLLEIRFKEVTGQTLYNYIIHQRMQYFAQLLIDSTAPVYDLALSIGMNNYGNVSRIFKSIEGCTPSEYRKKHR
jgi:LacI family transcriptional regulator